MWTEEEESPDRKLDPGLCLQAGGSPDGMEGGGEESCCCWGSESGRCTAWWLLHPSETLIRRGRQKWWGVRSEKNKTLTHLQINGKGCLWWAGGGVLQTLRYSSIYSDYEVSGLSMTARVQLSLSFVPLQHLSTHMWTESLMQPKNNWCFPATVTCTWVFAVLTNKVRCTVSLPLW